MARAGSRLSIRLGALIQVQRGMSKAHMRRGSDLGTPSVDLTSNIPRGREVDTSRADRARFSLIETERPETRPSAEDP